MNCEAPDPIFFKGAICFLILIAGVALHRMIYRLSNPPEHIKSDPSFKSEKFQSFLKSMRMKRNILTAGLGVAVITLNMPFSGWILFTLVGFLVGLFVHATRFLNSLRT